MLTQVSCLDKSLINSYLERLPYEGSIHNFIHMCQWMVTYPLFRYEDIEHRFLLLFYFKNNQYIAVFPLTEEIHFKTAIDQIKVIFKELKQPFIMKWIPDYYRIKVQEMLGDSFSWTSTDDERDYLYEADRMRTYAGKHMQKKRNHVNAFLLDCQDCYEFRQLTILDRDLCKRLATKWLIDKHTEDDLASDETRGVINVLDHWEELNLVVGGVFLAQELRAFSIASMNHFKTVQINIEKADHTIRGLYPFLSQMMLQKLFPDAQMVNREDDGGRIHLKKAKESFHPSAYLTKWSVSELTRVE